MAELIMWLVILWVGLNVAAIALGLASIMLAGAFAVVWVTITTCKDMFINGIKSISGRYEAPTKAVITNRLLCRKKEHTDGDQILDRS